MSSIESPVILSTASLHAHTRTCYFSYFISVTRAVLVLTCVACSEVGHSRWPSIVGRSGMSTAASAVPSDKPMSARTSIRTLSRGTWQDSLLTAVRTLHDTPDQEDGSASAGVGAHAATIVAVWLCCNLGL